MVAYDAFSESVRAWAHHDVAGALRHAEAAHRAAPDHVLYEDAARYLSRLSEEGASALYTDVGAFAAFISGGSNLPLYDNARRLLTERLSALHPATILDIGTGEGTIIVPVARQLEPQPRLTLCEPVLGLLERAVALADSYQLEIEAFPYGIAELLRMTEQRWEVSLATWSLQNLAPTARTAVLRQLATRCPRLFIAEFDDPSGAYADPLDPERIRHIHDRYEQGLREYPGEEGLRVRRGFLLPVLYGYFSHERRSTYEQPIASWERELKAAGWEPTARTCIAPYWWADAYLLEATVPLS